MHVIVVGCGRVGSTIARELDAATHSVVVVDKRSESFRRLGPSFGGRTIAGIGFDREVLVEAGIAPGCAVMAVTSGDNSNILIARVARETFGVERVVARIYDPRRATIYERLGIATVASVAWTAARALQLVLPDDTRTEWVDPTSRFALVERRVPAGGAGRSIADLETIGLRVALLGRNGDASQPLPSALIQQDDLLYVMAPGDRIPLLDRALHDASLDVGGDTKGDHR
jgi:trk system potassium uptake protein TrkA